MFVDQAAKDSHIALLTDFSRIRGYKLFFV